MSQIAKSLGISHSYLRNWMAQPDADEKGGDDRLTSAEEKCPDRIQGVCSQSLGETTKGGLTSLYSGW